MKKRKYNIVLVMIMLFNIIFSSLGQYVNAVNNDSYANGYPVTSYEEDINTLTSISSLSNGEIEVKKSVDYLDNGTFDISLLTQGKKYITKLNADTEFNISIVLDNSASMYWTSSRISGTINAVNSIIRTFSSYPNVKIGVVAYKSHNDGTNSVPAEEVLKLGHYTSSSSSDVYITYEDASTAWTDRNIIVKTSQNGNTYNKKIHAGLTNTMAGTIAGFEQLNAAKNKTTAKPVLILLTDGGANYYPYNSSGTQWEIDSISELVSYAQVCSDDHSGWTTNATPGYATIRNAMYIKNRLSEEYSKSALMYTYGFLESSNEDYRYMVATMNPTKTNIDNLKSYMASGYESKGIYNLVYNAINNSGLTWNQLLYTDGYNEIANGTTLANSLKNVLSQQATTENSAVSQNKYLTVTDNIAEGFEVTSTATSASMILNLNGTIKNIELSSSDGNIYKYSDSTVNVEYNKGTNIVTFKVIGSYYLDKSANLTFNITPKAATIGDINGETYYTNTSASYTFGTNTYNPKYSGATVTQNIDSTGSITLTKIPAKVLVHYVDESGNKLDIDEQLDGYIFDEYTTLQKEIYGYELIEVPTNATGLYTEEDIEVNYVYKKVPGTLKVNYIDKINNTILDTETKSGYVGDKVTTEAKTFDNYTLIESPAVEEYELVKDEQTVNYYYSPNTSVVVRHLDKYDHSIIVAEEKSINGYVGKDYSTEPSNNLIHTNYIYSGENTLNISGSMTQEQIIVQYYYLKGVNLNVKYIDKNTGTSIDENKNITEMKYQGELYNTQQKDFNGYRFVGDTQNTSGTIQRENITVIYYYKKISAGIEAKYIDQVTKEEIAKKEEKTGLENDEYTTESKDVEGYELVVTPNNASGKMAVEKITITYEYRKKADVITKHIDANTGAEIVPEVVKTYKEGDNYQVLAQNLSGYTLVEEPETKTGTVGRENITKIFKYKKISAGLIVKYVDEISNELLDEKAYTGNENDEIKLEELSFDDYILSRRPEEDKVALTVEPQEKYFYYKKMVELEIVGIDKDTGEQLYSKIQNGVDGEEYTTEPLKIPGYDVIEEPENKNGIYKKENDKVIYKYRKIAGALTVKYVDKDTNEELDSYEITGHVGDEYSTREKEFEDYNYVNVEGNPNGKLEENAKEIIYYYEKKTGKVIVVYENTDGNVLYTEEFEGKVKEEYIVEEREIENYRIVERPDNTTGEYIDGTIEVKFILEKLRGKIKINFVDREGNVLFESIETEGEVSEEYYLEAAQKEGYYIVENAVVNVQYINGELVIDVIYDKIPELPVTGDINVLIYSIVFVISLGFIVKKLKRN